MFKDSLVFIKSHIRDKHVATIASTSKFSIRKILENINFSKDIVIVEYGPGTGVITKELVKKMTKNSKLIAIEKNLTLYKKLILLKDPRLITLQEDVINIKDILKEKNISTVDYVISGIPFSYLSEKSRRQLVRHTYDIIKPGGSFILYQFSPLMVKYLKPTFKEVRKKFMPINIPPLFLMIGRK